MLECLTKSFIIVTEGADDVTKIMIANQSVDMVTVSWEAPAYPNGIIVSYSVEYRKIGLEDVRYIKFMYI